MGTTYRSYAELNGNTLCRDSFVYFGDIKYCVARTHLYSINGHSNWEIFSHLQLNKVDFCKEHYGYPSLGGGWPECKHDDYEALTRCVLALFKLFESKQKYFINNTPRYDPELIKSTILEYGGQLNPHFDYLDPQIYYWKVGSIVELEFHDEFSDSGYIELIPKQPIIIKSKQNENQFQRKKACIERRTRPEGSTVCGRRNKASVAVGHLGYRKVIGI